MYTGSTRLLLVEDNPGDVRLFREAVSRCSRSIQLSVAEDGESALKLLSRVTPHLVVLDLNMPAMDGHGLLEILKTSDALKMIPVVVFSSSENPNDVKGSYRLGANCFIRKPLDFDGIMMVLADFCRLWLEVAILPEPAAPAKTAGVDAIR